jgi:hypothetical protein
MSADRALVRAGALVLSISIIWMVAPVSVAAATAGAEGLRESRYGKLPMSFAANQGQMPGGVGFAAQGRGYSVTLSTGGSAELWLGTKAGQANKVGMSLAGAKATPRLECETPLPGKDNYLMGNDPSRWITGVATCAKVRYTGVYAGIDLLYYGHEGQLEYDFAVAPGSDAGAIRLEFDGAKRVELSPAGDLRIETDGHDSGSSEVVFRKPAVYQVRNGQRETVDGEFRLSGRNVGFKVGRYDRSRPLILDPTLVYSTYFGANSSQVSAIAVDASGEAFVTGNTVPTGLPGAAAYSGNAQVVAFVSKINAQGTATVYSTYLGGTASNTSESDGTGIAVDSGGEAWVVGATSALDFPLVNPLPGTSSTTPGNAFVSKFSADGSSLLFSTFLGVGAGPDEAPGGAFGVSAIALDSSGNAYVAGSTAQTNFPAASPLQSALNGSQDGVFAKIKADGSALVYSSYLGGSGRDSISGIAVDSSNDVYLAGTTSSTDFPTANPYQAHLSNSKTSAFLAKVNAAGTQLVYSTYLGGSIQDQGLAVAVDNLGSAYVTGSTQSSDFPTLHAYQPSLAAGSDITNAFITKFSPDGQSLVYSTYLGGNNANEPDGPSGVGLDSGNRAFVAGTTGSTNFPTVNAYETQNSTIPDNGSTGFVAEFSEDGTSLVYSTYLGGSGEFDSILGIAVAPDGSVYLGGQTASTDFPENSPIQTELQGATPDPNAAANGFITKFASANVAGSTTTTVTATANPQIVGQSVTFTATVVAASGNVGPAGTVTFTIDGGAGNSVALTPSGNDSGTAAYSTGTLAAGTHTVTANFVASAGGGSNSSGTLKETIDNPAADTPTFSPAPGNYTTHQTITLADATPHTTIYFTTDGSTPSNRSTRYTGAFRIATAKTIQAVAYAAGYPHSSVARGVYTFELPAAGPVFSMKAGTYSTDLSVTLSDTTPSPTIYYTTDGSTPTNKSTRYTGAIAVTASETIQAIADAVGYTSSPVATAAYVIQLPVAATPTFSVPPAEYPKAQSVKITSATAGTIYYTIDGSTPTNKSARYIGALTVKSTETLNAITYAPGYTPSAVASGTYTIP